MSCNEPYTDLAIYFRRNSEFLLGHGRLYDGTTRRTGLTLSPYPVDEINQSIRSLCVSRAGLDPRQVKHVGEWKTQDFALNHRRIALYVVSDFVGDVMETTHLIEPEWFEITGEPPHTILPVIQLGKEQYEILPRLATMKKGAVPLCFVFERDSHGPILQSLTALKVG